MATIDLHGEDGNIIARGIPHVVGSWGVVLGEHYHYIYRRIPGTDRYRFHSHGYEGWPQDDPYFRAITSREG
jgi:hypothetical protein